MLDTHTHCEHSHDSKEKAENSILRAIELGMDYLAITDHFDRDIADLRDFDCFRQIDLAHHFAELGELKQKYAGKIDLAIGLECGWAKRCETEYVTMLEPYKTDIILNSIHMINDKDCYVSTYFDGRGKRESYEEYLQSVRDSLDAPYRYDIVAHLGYVSRKAPYEDKRMRYSEFADRIDDILRTMIERGKALEINSHCGKTDVEYLPEDSIIARYKQLGGQLVTFGSDAHWALRIGDKFQLVSDSLKSLGFKYIFKYLEHKPIAVKL